MTLECWNTWKNCGEKISIPSGVRSGDFFFPLTHIAFLVSVTVGLRKGEVGNLCSRWDRLCEESLGREAAKSGAEWGEDALKF